MTRIKTRNSDDENVVYQLFPQGKDSLEIPIQQRLIIV